MNVCLFCKKKKDIIVILTTGRTALIWIWDSWLLDQ